MPLSKQFFEQPTLELAKNLLGKLLINTIDNEKTVGRIVEVEAYLGENDPASHAYRGETPRTKAMFDHPGRAYIYFTYGNYYCFNVTAAQKGIGEAVLIRALEPVDGIEIMQKRRQNFGKTKNDKLFELKDLCNGPAKLVISMGITKENYGHDLRKPPLMISSDEFRNEKFEIIETIRIGISKAKDFEYRFYIKDSPFISRK